MCRHVSACKCMNVSTGAQRGQERVLNSLGLELQEVVKINVSRTIPLISTFIVLWVFVLIQIFPYVWLAGLKFPMQIMNLWQSSCLYLLSAYSYEIPWSASRVMLFALEPRQTGRLNSDVQKAMASFTVFVWFSVYLVGNLTQGPEHIRPSALAVSHNSSPSSPLSNEMLCI